MIGQVIQFCGESRVGSLTGVDVATTKGVRVIVGVGANTGLTTTSLSNEIESFMVSVDRGTQAKVSKQKQRQIKSSFFTQIIVPKGRIPIRFIPIKYDVVNIFETN